MNRWLACTALACLSLATPHRPAAAAPAATASDASAEQQIRAAMELFRHAMLKKDAAAFDRLFHPALSYGHSIGLIENKTQATDHVMKSTTVYKAIDFAETKISVRGDTALVTGKMHYEKHPQGKPVLHQHLVVLSVWVKTAVGWQLLARQATEPNPTAAVAQGK